MYDNISKDKFSKSPNPHSYCGFGNGVESVRTLLHFLFYGRIIFLKSLNFMHPCTNEEEINRQLMRCFHIVIVCKYYEVRINYANSGFKSGKISFNFILSIFCEYGKYTMLRINCNCKCKGTTGETKKRKNKRIYIHFFTFHILICTSFSELIRLCF